MVGGGVERWFHYVKHIVTAKRIVGKTTAPLCQTHRKEGTPSPLVTAKRIVGKTMVSLCQTHSDRREDCGENDGFTMSNT